MNRYTKLAIALEILVVILFILTLSDFEFADIDPDEQFILIGFVSLISSLVLSLSGVYKEFHRESTATLKTISIMAIVAVPVLFAIVVFGVMSTFSIF